MADTNKGRKFFISTSTADSPVPLEHNADLTEAEFVALLWTEVKHVGSIGQTGTDTNIVSYDELSTDVTQKQKGISNAGDPEIECARLASDPGQQAMRAAARTKFFYAFKIEDDDAPGFTAPATGSSPTTYYMRGLTTGPARPNGRNEDFNLEVYKLGLTQYEIIVEAAVDTVLGTLSAPGGPGAQATPEAPRSPTPPAAFVPPTQQPAPPPR